MLAIWYRPSLCYFARVLIVLQIDYQSCNDPGLPAKSYLAVKPGDKLQARWTINKVSLDTAAQAYLLTSKLDVLVSHVLTTWLSDGPALSYIAEAVDDTTGESLPLFQVKSKLISPVKARSGQRSLKKDSFNLTEAMSACTTLITF